MKKSLNLLFACLSLFGMTLTGCSQSSGGGDNTHIVETDGKYEIYELYKASGGTMSYEEWLGSIKGADGSSLLTGTTNPDSSTGNNGDTYINTTTWDVFVKSGGNWAKVGNIMGQQGPKGDQGETGPQGPQGEPGQNGQDGKDGQDGRSVVSITLTSSNGNVDTYTITYSDGTTSTFTVTNGVDGQNGQNGSQGPKGEQGIQGQPGADGHTPVITIGNNGNWFVDGVDTGIKAQGPKGDQGETGPQGPQGPAGQNGSDGVSIVDTYIDENGDLIIVYSDGTSTNAGKITNTSIHTVTFDTRGGSEIGPQQIAHGEKVVKPDDPVRPGYNFVDWVDENNDHWVFNGFSVTANITLYAVWSDPIDYVINFVNDDGSLLYSTTSHYGDSLEYPYSEPTPVSVEDHYSYSFSGWDKDLVVTGNMTFVAQYTKTYTPYTAVFLAEDGTELYRTAIAEGETPVYVGDLPTKESDGDTIYQFVQWREESRDDDLITYKPIFDSCTRGLSFDGQIVTGYSGTATIVNIPSRWGGYDIVSIGDNAFEATSVRKVTIPEGVRTIKNYVFNNCQSLKEIILPETLTWIGKNAFYNCVALELDELPSALTNIGNYAFYSCRKISLTVLPDSINYIGSYAFNGCSQITSIVFPSSITQISEYSFGHTGLKIINIPNNVTFVGQYAFDGTFFSEVYIPKSVTTVQTRAFASYSGVPDGIVYIEHETKPANWTPYWQSDSGEITSYVIWGYKNTIQCGAYSVAQSENNGEKYASIVDFDDSISQELIAPAYFGEYRVIGLNAYNIKNKYNLRTVDISALSFLFSISDYGFSSCTSLTSVVLPDSIETIGKNAFSGCSSLTTIILPDNVESIGDWAFSSCSSLALASLPATVTSMGYYAFYTTANLIDIYYRFKSDEDIELFASSDSRFSFLIRHQSSNVHLLDNKGNEMTKIVIPDSVYSIGTSAFSNCKYLTTIVFPDTLESLGQYCFSRCSSLVNVSIPNSVSHLGDLSFAYCTSLSSVYIYNSLGSFANGVFQNCTSITLISLPDLTNNLDVNMFPDCINLEAIVLPVSLNSIGNNVFAKFSSLSVVYYKGNSDEWNLISINSGNENLTTATIYYYSETQPVMAGNYWHYVNGVPTIW